MPRIKNKLKTRLERERLAAKLTQTDLARLADIQQSTVSKLEAQLMPRPGFDVLASLAWALKRCGRKIDAADLQPKRQPILVKGNADRKSRKREAVSA